jgi:molecular chaperone GrpE
VHDGSHDDDSQIEILEIVGFVEDEPGPAEREQESVRLPSRLSDAREDGRMAGLRQVLRELLPALDDLESSVRKAADLGTVREGVRLGLRQLMDVFRVHDLERIEGTGIRFNPQVHDAVAVSQTDRVEPNLVVEVLRVGYMLGGELVRPALVRVSAPLEEEETVDERFRSPSMIGREEPCS